MFFYPECAKKLEKLILDSPYLYFGFHDVECYLKSRWLEFENKIENLDSISESDLQSLFRSVSFYRKEPWKKFEHSILEH